MEIIDLRKNNCWFVWLLPFDKTIRDDMCIVVPYQQSCIEKNIFGIGWRKDSNPEAIENVIKGMENDPQLDKSKLQAFKYLSEIKVNDYVLTRTKDGYVYIGRVSETAAQFGNTDDIPSEDILNAAEIRFKHFSDHFSYVCSDGRTIQSRREFLNEPEISYGCHVEKWYKCQLNDIPSEIQGRFSQALHRTIQPVKSIRQQVLIRSMYEIVRSEEGVSSMPKVLLSEKNFSRSLTYKELEDLAAFHILQEPDTNDPSRKANDGYMLQPSSCKINEQKYEFRFACQGKKPITCQVKNLKDVNPRDYFDDNDNYSKIYLFSGLWTENTIEEKKKEASEGSNIIIISPKELFGTLYKNRFLINEKYYSFEEPDFVIDERKLHYCNIGGIVFEKKSGKQQWTIGSIESDEPKLRRCYRYILDNANSNDFESSHIETIKSEEFFDVERDKDLFFLWNSVICSKEFNCIVLSGETTSTDCKNFDEAYVLAKYLVTVFS